VSVPGTLKYIAVRDALKERFGQAPVGSQVPTEGQLCAEYGVSRITLRKAVDYLVAEGSLVREQGRGTFIAEPPVAHRYSTSLGDDIGGFHVDMTNAGFAVQTRVLRQSIEPAADDAARRLELEPGTPVISLLRLRSVDGAVNHLVETTLPGKRFATIEHLSLDEQSLYAHMKSALGVTFGRAEFVVEVQYATAEQAELLQVSDSDPLLVTSSTVFDQNDVPIVWGRSWLLPGSNQIEFEHVTQAGVSRQHVR
jgi:GntR family transcriptional regulator